MRPGRVAAGVMIALLLAARAAAQEPAAPEAAPAPAEAAPAKPKPRPKPRPKTVKPQEAKPKETRPEEARPDARSPSAAVAAGTRPVTEPTGPVERAAPTRSASKPSSPPPPQSPSQGAFAAPVIACDPGQSVLYDGPNEFALWVTRTGTVTIDNPLRPLTPDVTRVLQLVIAGKLATAYGPDLTALRRGGAPGALEGTLGGPIRWDAALATLPDTLNIVGDSGRTLAEMRFKECGTAPAAKAPAPVAKRRDEKPRPPRKAPPAAEAGARPPSGPPSAEGAAPPRRSTLPQGALPE